MLTMAIPDVEILAVHLLTVSFYCIVFARWHQLIHPVYLFRAQTGCVWHPCSSL